MTDREAIVKLEEFFEWLGGISECTSCDDSIAVALSALKEREERARGCEFCNGGKTLYQHTVTTKLYMNTFGKARTLVTECTPCPPYAKCCLKGDSCNSAFLINYCPECGRPLKGSGHD